MNIAAIFENGGMNWQHDNGHPKIAVIACMQCSLAKALVAFISMFSL